MKEHYGFKKSTKLLKWLTQVSPHLFCYFLISFETLAICRTWCLKWLSKLQISFFSCLTLTWYQAREGFLQRLSSVLDKCGRLGLTESSSPNAGNVKRRKAPAVAHAAIGGQRRVNPPPCGLDMGIFWAGLRLLFGPRHTIKKFRNVHQIL